jgi:hypothetical protein
MEHLSHCFELRGQAAHVAKAIGFGIGPQTVEAIR